MPRVNYVKKCRKAQGTCPCGHKIKKGDPYKWIKFRYGGRRIKCDNCGFRSSELTSSDKLSRLYSAQETTCDALTAWEGEDVENLRSILEEAASEIREVGEEYQESAENIREHFESSDTADQCEEKAEDCEGWADEIENVDLEAFEYDKDAKENEDEQRETWADNVRSEVESAVDNCPL